MHLLYLKLHIHTTKSVSALSKLKTSVKFVQTTAEVCRKYYVLTNLSTRTHLKLPLLTQSQT